MVDAKRAFRPAVEMENVEALVDAREAAPARSRNGTRSPQRLATIEAQVGFPLLYLLLQ